MKNSDTPSTPDRKPLPSGNLADLKQLSQSQTLVPKNNDLQALSQAQTVVPQKSRSANIVTNPALSNGTLGLSDLKAMSQAQTILPEKNTSPAPLSSSDLKNLSQAPTMLPKNNVDPNATIVFVDADATQANSSTNKLNNDDPLVKTIHTGLQLSQSSLLSTLSLQSESTKEFKKNLHLPNLKLQEGRFSVSRKIAEGGMGAVLEISDHDFGRSEAMKVIKPEARQHADSLFRFLAEARVTAQLEHPNIVPIHDMGSTGDGTIYFTMKLIHGQSFGDVLKKLRDNDQKTKEIWDENNILLAFLKVLDGIGFAHEKHIIHRDIKPDNIMIGPYGEVLVVDWGIAKVLDAVHDETFTPPPAFNPKDTPLASQEGDITGMTLNGQAMGTPMYMPPEQASGELAKIDARSDVYALGATLYELITLKKAFEADSLMTLIYKINCGDMIAVQQAKPDVNPDLAAIITKAMSCEPSRRYKSCTDFSTDLRKYLAGQAVEARRRSLSEALRLWFSAHRKEVAISCVSALTIALIAGGGYVWFTIQNQHRVKILLESAHAKFDDGIKNVAIAKMRDAAQDLKQAEGIDDNNQLVRELQIKVSSHIANLESRAQEIADREQNKKTAERFKNQADDDLKNNRLKEAEGAYTAALKLLPPEEQAPILDALRIINVRMGDEVARAQTSEALQHIAKASAQLEVAKKLDPRDTTLPESIDRIRTELNLAGKDGKPPVQALAITEQLTRLVERTQIAQQKVKDVLKAQELASEATAALAAHRDDEARTKAVQALVLDPLCNAASTVRSEAEIRLARAEEERKRLATFNELEKKSRLALTNAQTSFNQLPTLITNLRDAQSLVEKRSIELEKSPLEKKSSLWTAHEKLRDAEIILVHARSHIEKEASAAAAYLDAFPDNPIRHEARSLLTHYYQDCLNTAISAGDDAGSDAYRRLLAKVDDGQYEKNMKEPGVIHVSGSGSLTLCPVKNGLDTRFITDAARQETLTLPLEKSLPAGRWQLEDQRNVRMTVIVEAGKKISVSWPKKLPVIPGIDLGYVPAAPKTAAFCLSRTEITNGQYLLFLNHHSILPMVAAQCDLVAEQPKGEAVLIHVPRKEMKGGILYITERAAGPGTPITGFSLSKEMPSNLPVTYIDRSDAEAYCAWLSETTGVQVRLPSSAEFTRACQMGDPERHYPWGKIFDGAFAHTAFQKPTGPAPVGSIATDEGPCGHRDLAGNVREWLAGESRLGALIACGGWSDDTPAIFSSTYTESIQSIVTNPVIGFRILAEVNK